jgi:hypothetical protein
MHVTKRLDLPALTQELAAAGIDVPNGLATSGWLPEAPYEQELFTSDGRGGPSELPPGSQAVVDAHIAPPLVTSFAVAVPIEGIARTTDGLSHELLRFPLATESGYDVEVQVMGVDAGNGAVKKLVVDVTMKRLLGGPQAVGAPTTLVAHQDSQASAWAVGFSFSGNDALVSVTGASGRTIDWICRGSVGRFAPAGL